MPKNQYISLILFFIVLVTLVNLYAKPELADRDNETTGWFGNLINPILKSACPLQGYRCPSDESCDCEKQCGTEFEQFRVVDRDRPIYVMNQKLSPGTYCLPKGVGKCNLKTSYHVFTLAGWSCLGLNDDVFKGDKRKACKNEEAEDDDLNFLYDKLLQKPAEDNVDDYYETLSDSGALRYGCVCGSKALDGTPMVSAFPFVCSVDYCLRDIPNPLPFMGWNGTGCECGLFEHLDEKDATSPCRKEVTKMKDMVWTGRVDCMTKQSFVKQALICPTDDGIVRFKEHYYEGNKPQEFVSELLKNNLI